MSGRRGKGDGRGIERKGGRVSKIEFSFIPTFTVKHMMARPTHYSAFFCLWLRTLSTPFFMTIISSFVMRP